MIVRASAALLLLTLAACNASEGTTGSGPTEPYSGIGPSESVHFTGTEPFWGGEVNGGELRYTTPEDGEGQVFAVKSFPGNHGISYSGIMQGQSFDMMVTPGECSDGMSDRTYPFTVTLKIDSDQRNGCAWTDKQPFSGPAQP